MLLPQPDTFSALTPVELTVESTSTDPASFQHLQLLPRRYEELQEQEEEQLQRLEYENALQLYYQEDFQRHQQKQHQQQEQEQHQQQQQQQLQYPPPAQQQALFSLVHQFAQAPPASAAAPPQPIAVACNSSGDDVGGLCEPNGGSRRGNVVPVAIACGSGNHVAGVDYDGSPDPLLMPSTAQSLAEAHSTATAALLQRHPPYSCTANDSYSPDFATTQQQQQQQQQHQHQQQPQQPTTGPAFISSATSLAFPPAAVFLTSITSTTSANPATAIATTTVAAAAAVAASASALPSSPRQLRIRRLRLAQRRQAAALTDRRLVQAFFDTQPQPHALSYLPFAFPPLPHQQQQRQQQQQQQQQQRHILQILRPDAFTAMAVDLPKMNDDGEAADAQLAAQLEADHIAAEIAAQEALARNYEPDVTGPAIGNIQSTDVVRDHYATADTAFAEKTETLPSIFPLYRSVLGDGNCGWRAIGFCYFEALIHAGDREQLVKERTRLLILNDYIRDVGKYNPYVYEDMVEETDILFDGIINAMPDTNKAAEILVNTFNNDAGSGNAIIYHFRLLAASYLKDNALLYQDFLIHEEGLDGYCREYIERPNCEIDHVRIEVLATVLLKPADIVLEIAYLDRSEGTNVALYCFPSDNNGRDESSIGLRISLLFRPDHYDILYRPGLPFTDFSMLTLGSSAMTDPKPQDPELDPSGPPPDGSNVQQTADGRDDLVSQGGLAEQGSLDSGRFNSAEGAAVLTVLGSSLNSPDNQTAASASASIDIGISNARTEQLPLAPVPVTALSQAIDPKIGFPPTSEPALAPPTAGPSLSAPPPSSTDLHVNHTRVSDDPMFSTNTSSLGNYSNVDLTVLSFIPGMMTTLSARPNYASSPSGQPPLPQSPWTASTNASFGGGLCSLPSSAPLVPLVESPQIAMAEAQMTAEGLPVGLAAPALKSVDQYIGGGNDKLSLDGMPVSYTEAVEAPAELTERTAAAGLPESAHLHASHQMHLPQQQQLRSGFASDTFQSHPVRFTKWQFERSNADANPDMGFLRSSRLSTAHFSNPEFQPEEYQPTGEDGRLETSRGRKKGRRSEKSPSKN